MHSKAGSHFWGDFTHNYSLQMQNPLRLRCIYRQHCQFYKQLCNLLYYIIVIYAFFAMLCFGINALFLCQKKHWTKKEIILLFGMYKHLKEETSGCRAMMIVFVFSYLVSR